MRRISLSALVALLATPASAWAQGLESFVITYSFVGVVIGTVVGAVSAWRQIHPVKAFVVALVILAMAAMLPDFAARFDLESMLGAILLAPLLGFLPTAAGFVVGRQFASRFSHRSKNDAIEKPGDS